MHSINRATELITMKVNRREFAVIRKMRMEDAVRAAEISVYGWRDTYRGIISDDILFKRILVPNKIQYFEGAIGNQTEHQGIGEILVEFCEDQGKILGYREVVIWTLEANQTARKFYEKHGYCIDGKVKYIEGLKAKEIRYS